MIGGVNIIDMIIMLVAFLVLMALVKKFAWGPVMDMMEKRESYVANEIDQAEASRKEAEQAAKEANEQLKQTRQEAQKIVEDAKSAGVKQEEDIIAAARQTAEQIKTQAHEEIQNEKEKALQELQDKVASLSVMIASKVIEKEISEQDQDQLIQDYIKQVGDSE